MSFWNRFRKAGFFSYIYFVQGACLSYFINFQKPYLNSRHVPLESIGTLSSILLLPFILKMAFGYISDRWSPFGLGYRKPYIIFGVALSAVGFFLCSIFNPESHFAFFCIFIFCSSLGMAIYDSTSDGLAVESAQKEEQSFVQSSMMVGRSLGLILVSLAIGFIAKKWGFPTVFMILAALVISALLLLPLVPKEKHIESENESIQNKNSKTSVVWFCLFAIAYSTGSFAIDGLVSIVMSREHNVTAEQMGSYGAIKGIGAILGALALGLLSLKVRRKVLGVFSLLGIIIGGISAPLMLTPETLNYFGIIWGFFWGFQETAYLTFAMKYAVGKRPAFTFAIFMALSNLGTSIGDGMSTRLLASNHFIHLFYTGSVVVGLAILFWILSETNFQNQRRIPPI